MVIEFKQVDVPAEMETYHRESGGTELRCFQAELGPNHFLQAFVAREPWNDDGRQLHHVSLSVRHKFKMEVIRLPNMEEMAAAMSLAPVKFTLEFHMDHAHLWEKIR